MRRIGDDRREAIDWIQDRLSLTRPEAETSMIRFLKEHIAITTEEGIFLTEEEDEEINRKGKRFSQRISQRKTGKKMARLGKQVNNKVPKKDKDKDDEVS